MIEIIVDGKTERERLFDTYISNENNYCYFSAKNNEIRKYCEFLKSYYFNNKNNNYNINNFFVMDIDKEKYKKVNYSIIEDHENFLFEFPDNYSEEDLFYFKLKYC